MSCSWNQAICDALGKLSQDKLKAFKMILWKRYPQSFNTPPQTMDTLDLVDRLLECFDLEVSLQITKMLLEEIGQKKIVDYLQTLCIRSKYSLYEPNAALMLIPATLSGMLQTSSTFKI